MKKIMVGVDGSAESRAAAGYAATLAAAQGATLVLAHFFQAPIVAAPASSEPLEAREREYGLAVLRETMARCHRPGLEVTTLLRRGAAATGLAAAALEQNAELVVVGHRGRGSLTGFLVGSVADRLVHLCKRPLLIHR